MSDWKERWENPPPNYWIRGKFHDGENFPYITRIGFARSLDEAHSMIASSEANRKKTFGGLMEPAKGTSQYQIWEVNINGWELIIETKEFPDG